MNDDWVSSSNLSLLARPPNPPLTYPEIAGLMIRTYENPLVSLNKAGYWILGNRFTGVPSPGRGREAPDRSLPSSYFLGCFLSFFIDIPNNKLVNNGNISPLTLPKPLVNVLSSLNTSYFVRIELRAWDTIFAAWRLPRVVSVIWSSRNGNLGCFMVPRWFRNPTHQKTPPLDRVVWRPLSKWPKSHGWIYFRVIYESRKQGSWDDTTQVLECSGFFT